MIGISIRENIGVGDKVQFSSLPENYFRTFGEKLVDVSKAWIFDHNPYVVRDVVPEKTIDLWNFPQIWEWPKPRSEVYLSNAEIWASLFKADVFLARPRLYKNEDFAFENRKMILFHTHGKSHGRLPDHVIDHVLKKYKPTGRLYHIGTDDEDFGIPKIHTSSLWDLSEVISKSRMLIGVDSGPSWIAACYPDVQIKKVRVRKVHGQVPMNEWVPMQISNIHSHWDDRLFSIHNVSEDDLGPFPSYRRI